MKNLAETIIGYIFGCHHRNLSHLLTIHKRCYCVCHDGCKSIDYFLKTTCICCIHTVGNPGFQNDLQMRTA